MYKKDQVRSLPKADDIKEKAKLLMMSGDYRDGSPFKSHSIEIPDPPVHKGVLPKPDPTSTKYSYICEKKIEFFEARL